MRSPCARRILVSRSRSEPNCAKLCSSRGDARRNVEQGGVTVADAKVTDSRASYTKEDIGAGGMIVRRGKKNFVRVISA